MYDIPNSGPTPDNFDDVGMFHQKFGLDNTTFNRLGPREVDDELLSFRLNFLLEELTELVVAAGGHYQPEYEPPDLSEDGVPAIVGLRVVIPGDNKKDHPVMFDSLLDLAYVVFGTAHLLGYPWQEGWDQVQAANMAKVRAQADGSDSQRGSSFDVVKPEGWKPPDIEGLLRGYGWEDA